MALHDELFLGSFFKKPPHIKGKESKKEGKRKYAKKSHEKTSTYKRKTRG